MTCILVDIDPKRNYHWIVNDQDPKTFARYCRDCTYINIACFLNGIPNSHNHWIGQDKDPKSFKTVVNIT